MRRFPSLGFACRVLVLSGLFGGARLFGFQMRGLLLFRGGDLLLLRLICL